MKFYLSTLDDYRVISRSLPKDQIDSYYFQRKGGKAILIIKPVDKDLFLIPILGKKVVEPIQNILNVLELKHEKSTANRVIEQKKGKRIKKPKD